MRSVYPDYDIDKIKKILELPVGLVQPSPGYTVNTLFSTGFIWNSTEEGYKFWKDICEGRSPLTKEAKDSLLRQAVLQELLK